MDITIKGVENVTEAEVMEWGDSTTNKLYTIPAVVANPGVTPAIPACPSIILTVGYTGKD